MDESPATSGQGRLLERLPRTATRYGVALVAPGSVSAAHFLLQLVLIQLFLPAQFGSVALILAVIQFGFGLSNALVATPYTVAVNRPADDAHTQAADANPAGSIYFLVNAAFCIGMGLVCAAISHVFNPHPAASVAWGLAGGLTMLRWFGRAHAYAHHTPYRAAGSDLTYSLTLVGGLGLSAAFGAVTYAGTGLLFALAALSGGAALGTGFFGSHRRMLGARFAAYRPVWRDQARWMLLGVTATEATANAHVYLIAAFMGPTALAPVAAAGLFIKPIHLAITSLTQLERPVMTRAVFSRSFDQLDKARRQMAAALGLALLATIAVTVLVLVWFPHLIVRPDFPPGTVEAAAALWALIALLQVLQTPAGVLLQGASRFRALSMINVRSSLVSLVAATTLLLMAGAVPSLFGIVLGLAFSAFWIKRAADRWRRDAEAADAP